MNMSVTAKILTAPLSNDVEIIEGDNLLDILADRYSVFPEHARIYDSVISQGTDITPGTMLAEDGSLAINQSDLDRLRNFNGIAVIVEYPTDITFGQVFLFIASLLLTIALRPKVPEPPLQQTPSGNVDSRSASNQLAARTNQPRPLARIPDIYGTVRVTPDLIGYPIKTFIGTIETETSIMCIGRGEFDVSDIREGETLVTNISGASVSVFGPGTNLNNLPPAQVQIGSAYAPIDIIRQSNAVNGQTLEPNNATNLRAEGRIKTFGENVVIEVISDGVGAFSVGDTVTLDIPYDRFEPHYSSSRTSDDADTQYRIRRNTIRERLHGDFTITGFPDPNNLSILQINTTIQINERFPPSWWPASNALIPNGLGYPSVMSTFTSGIGSVLIVSSGTSDPRWVGPFEFDKSPNGQPQTLVMNFVAPNGLYRTDRTQDTKIDVQLELEFQYWLDDGSLLVLPDGTSKFTAHFTLAGSAADKRRIGSTLNYNTAVGFRGQVRVRRVTNTEYSVDFQQTDTVIFDSLYITTSLSPTDHFGDVTFVVATIPANPESVIIRDRKLNMLVTRRLPLLHNDGVTIGTTNEPTNRAIDAIHAMTVDPLIGRRTVADLNVKNLVSTGGDIFTYFGNSKLTEFSAIFDDRNQSYEDMIQIVAQAIFCVPYRRGGILNLSFDKLGRDARLLFNHRNTLPGSPVKTTNFGTEDDRDGIEFSYVSPETDTQEIIAIPAEGAINPSRTDSVGIRTIEQARIHANRRYNRLLYQDTVIERDVTEEAALLVNNDIIICADGTRPGIQDGEILAVDGLTLELSQPVLMDSINAYAIFLQLDDGSTQAIPVTSGINDTHVILAAIPALRRPLVTDSDKFARTTYQIVKADDSDLSRFILTERSNSGRGQFGIQAINYDPRYYNGDQSARIS